MSINRIIIIILLCFDWGQCRAQIIYNVDTPTNYDCETALSICSSITYNANYTSNLGGNLPCVFIAFTITEPTNVNILATATYDNSSSTFKLSTAGPFDPNYPCPGPPCGLDDVGNLSGGWFNEILLPGVYYIYGSFSGNYTASLNIDVITPSSLCPNSPCEDCLPIFSPLPGKEYVLSAWVKQEDAPNGTTSYMDMGPQVVVETPIGTPMIPFKPTGKIIDGWQLIERKFTMPANPSGFKVSLETTMGAALFDDVRIFPADGSMKCYVYDPVTLRFVAELDERHFATFYEYDNEGKLVRVKKETERGIKTLKETRENTHHAQ